jgi:hypothetical protein
MLIGMNPKATLDMDNEDEEVIITSKKIDE